MPLRHSRLLGHRVHTMTPTSPSSHPLTVRTARSRVAELIRRQAPGTCEHVVDDALLVVTELVTNAVRHGGGIAAFDPRIRDDRLELHVADHSEGRPLCSKLSRTQSMADEGGFGWPIVCRLTEAVTISRTNIGGKEVHATLSLSQPRCGTPESAGPRSGTYAAVP